MDPKYIQPVMIVAMFAVMYFFFIRPQSQKAKREKEFVDSLEKGTKVVTTNGIHGTIDRIEDGTILLEVDRNVKIRIEKSGISADMTQAINKTAEDKKA